MADYDNTNSGIAGKPWPEQRLLLNGKLNVMGEDMQIVIVTAETNAGDKRLEVFQKIGVLFTNDKDGNEKAPDYSGPLDGLHQDWRIAGWRGEKDGRKFMSLKVSEKQKQQEEPAQQQEAASQEVEDDIPF